MTKNQKDALALKQYQREVVTKSVAFSLPLSVISSSISIVCLVVFHVPNFNRIKIAFTFLGFYFASCVVLTTLFSCLLMALVKCSKTLDNKDNYKNNTYYTKKEKWYYLLSALFSIITVILCFSVMHILKNNKVLPKHLFDNIIISLFCIMLVLTFASITIFIVDHITNINKYLKNMEKQCDIVENNYIIYVQSSSTEANTIRDTDTITEANTIRDTDTITEANTICDTDTITEANTICDTDTSRQDASEIDRINGLSSIDTLNSVDIQQEFECNKTAKK